MGFIRTFTAPSIDGIMPKPGKAAAYETVPYLEFMIQEGEGQLVIHGLYPEGETG